MTKWVYIDQSFLSKKRTPEYRTMKIEKGNFVNKSVTEKNCDKNIFECYCETANTSSSCLVAMYKSMYDLTTLQSFYCIKQYFTVFHWHKPPLMQLSSGGYIKQKKGTPSAWGL